MPQVHPDAWIAPTATLIGDIVVEEGASVWYGAVIRADHGPIVVRRRANVQDGSVLHGGDTLTEIGDGASVAATCVSCTVPSSAYAASSEQGAW